MCTAINETTSRHLFGRTLDLEYTFGEEVVITPRRFPLRFLHKPTVSAHSAIIGTAHVRDGTPLYYDAVNETGLCAAALNFPNYSVYNPPKKDAHNIASFELIPWILSRAETLSQAEALLASVNITDESFDRELPATPLHWIFADKCGCVVVESTRTGVAVHENPFGVMTNSPDFAFHFANMQNYAHLSVTAPSKNQICETPYSRGLSAFGLPGDWSSASRFVRAAFVKENTAEESSTGEQISRFFHMMSSVSQPRGITKSNEGKNVFTVYTSAIDTASLGYCFTTYKNRRISCVRLTPTLADAEALVRFSMDGKEDFSYLN